MVLKLARKNANVREQMVPVPLFLSKKAGGCSLGEQAACFSVRTIYIRTFALL